MVTGTYALAFWQRGYALSGGERGPIRKCYPRDFSQRQGWDIRATYCPRVRGLVGMARKPLISSQVPYTHAHEASIAFWEGEQPIVAWSEERNVKLAGLFVARWDGSRWQRLGELNPEGDDYYLSPTIVVDAAKQIWLCWKEGHSGSLRVVRWDGVSWRDIGREKLRKLTHRKGSATEPSFAVDSKAQAWVLWSASKKPGKASLALARWNGTTWTLVPVPHVTGGKEGTGCGRPE